MAIKEKGLLFEIFGKVCNIIKGRVERLKPIRTGCLLEYKDSELVWKSRCDEKKETMHIKFLLVGSEKVSKATLH